MKVVIILSLLYPGESTFEELKRVEVASMQECRAVARELRAVLKAPEGFQYVTECSNDEPPVAGANAGWLTQNYDRDPTRIKKTKE